MGVGAYYNVSVDSEVGGPLIYRQALAVAVQEGVDGGTAWAAHDRSFQW